MPLTTTLEAAPGSATAGPPPSIREARLLGIAGADAPADDGRPLRWSGRDYRIAAVQPRRPGHDSPVYVYLTN